MNSGTRTWDRRWLLPPALLLLVAAALRLTNLNAPPLDFHPTRQLRNALVARAVYYDALPEATAQQRLLADSFRRAVGQYEPPVVETIVGGTFLLMGGESFAVGRIYGTLFWLLAAVALYALCRRTAAAGAALVPLAYFLLLPFAVQASRSFQPDPLMTACFVVGTYFMYRWSEQQQWRWAILGSVFLGLAVLVKVVIAFMVAGGAIALVLVSLGRRFWRSSQVWAMAAAMILPAFAYYILFNPARSGEYFIAWTLDLLRLVSSPHFYADWLGFVGSLLGLTVLVLSLVGAVLAPARLRSLLAGLWVGYMLYGLALPFQMFTHSYYHLQLVPVVALGLLPLTNVIEERSRALTPILKVAAVAPLLLLAVYEGWAARSVLVAQDYSAVPAFWQTVGEAIPPDANVTALTQDYGFDLMYWGWRKVRLWPLNTALSDLRKQDRELTARFEEITAGSRYFLVTAFGQLQSQPALARLLEGYRIASQGDGYILYDLNAAE